jgi:hypothetical protein
MTKITESAQAFVAARFGGISIEEVMGHVIACGADHIHRHAKKRGQKRVIYSNLHFSELELLSLPNTSPQLQRESSAPQWSCKLVELLLQSWFGGAGALPNTH